MNFIVLISPTDKSCEHRDLSMELELEKENNWCSVG